MYEAHLASNLMGVSTKQPTNEEMAKGHILKNTVSFCNMLTLLDVQNESLGTFVGLGITVIIVPSGLPN